ncbi:hypothetical protein HYX58_05170 [Candidatus Dependentiae bacterium]|nr:hypothetical protein [Candidatus Dependentiae bacterium]
MFKDRKQQVGDAGFPTHPSQIDEDTKKIILATNALSLSPQKRIELEREKDFTFDFINPIDPTEGYCESTWD